MLKKGVAIIGTGYGLRVIYNCISKTRNFYVRSVFSRTEKKNIFTNNIKKILSDKKISLICLETPPFTHLEYLNKFKNLRCKILCEKPFLLNLKEINFFKKNYKKYNFNLTINYQLRYHPALKIFKSKIKMIGKIKEIEIRYYSNNLREKKNDWWLDRNKGGGHLLAIAPHLLDVSNYLNGSILNLEKKIGTSNKFKKKIDTKFKLSGNFKNLSKLKILSSCNEKNYNKSDLKIIVKGSSGVAKFINFNKVMINLENKNNKIFNTNIELKDNFFNNPWRVAQYYFFKEKYIKFSSKKNKFSSLNETINNLKLLIKK